jgi:hypothetical protein
MKPSVLGLLAGSLLPLSSASAVTVTVPNFSFETGNQPPANSPITPNGTDSEQFDGMMTEIPDSPQNWTFMFEFNPAATTNNLWGTQVPRANGTGNNNFYGSKPGFNGVTSLPTPFDGIQFAFFNLNNDATLGGGTIARADSDQIGFLEAGTYTLTLAVGARSTTAWRNIDYSAGLVGSSTGELIPFAHQIMDPDSAAGNVPFSATATDQTNIADLTYSFAVPLGSPLIGEEYFIRIRAENTGVGGTGAFTQANFDNVRLDFTPIPEPNSIMIASLAPLLGARRRRRSKDRTD